MWPCEGDISTQPLVGSPRSISDLHSVERCPPTVAYFSVYGHVLSSVIHELRGVSHRRHFNVRRSCGYLIRMRSWWFSRRVTDLQSQPNNTLHRRGSWKYSPCRALAVFLEPNKPNDWSFRSVTHYETRWWTLQLKWCMTWSSTGESRSEKYQQGQRSKSMRCSFWTKVS